MPLCKAPHKGKTWLPCAFGVAVCRAGHKIKYYKMRHLIDSLLVTRAALDSGYQRLFDRLKKTHLLIIEDFFLHEVSSDDMGELLELVDARPLTGSRILCSQYQHESWIKIMGRTAISEAFMSRIKSSSHIIKVSADNDLRMANSRLLKGQLAKGLGRVALCSVQPCSVISGTVLFFWR